MKELYKISKIKRENLDEKDYFNSLIKEAYKENMITEEEINKMQIEILQLLDEKIYQYNGKENNSIRKEIMEQINNSNYYTIGIQLKKQKDPDEAIKYLIQKGIKETYYAGREEIEKELKKIRLMYVKIKQNKLNIQNEIYNDTINGGIQGFLKIYNPEFKAYDKIITADYPIYNEKAYKYDGIEFIRQYVNSIYLENQFCQKFRIEKIEDLLLGYSENYQKLVMNIFEIILLQVIACKMVKCSIYELEISMSDLERIYVMLRSKKEIEIQKIIKIAYNEICEKLLKVENELQKYCESNLKMIIKQIENGVKNKTLDKIFMPYY